MKTFKQIVEESADSPSAKHQFNRMKAGTAAVGAHAGNLRIIYNHKGGSLNRTLVGEHDHFSYGSTKNGHHYAQRYSSKPGHEVHMYAHFPPHAEMDVHQMIHAEVERQNPHLKGTGHATNFANDIIKHHIET